MIADYLKCKCTDELKKLVGENGDLPIIFVTTIADDESAVPISVLSVKKGRVLDDDSLFDRDYVLMSPNTLTDILRDNVESVFGREFYYRDSEEYLKELEKESMPFRKKWKDALIVELDIERHELEEYY